MSSDERLQKVLDDWYTGNVSIGEAIETAFWTGYDTGYSRGYDEGQENYSYGYQCCEAHG